MGDVEKSTMSSRHDDLGLTLIDSQAGVDKIILARRSAAWRVGRSFLSAATAKRWSRTCVPSRCRFIGSAPAPEPEKRSVGSKKWDQRPLCPRCVVRQSQMSYVGKE